MAGGAGIRHERGQEHVGAGVCLATSGGSAVRLSLAKVFAWLERHGIDCSGLSNKGDAVAIAFSFGLMGVLVLLLVSQFLAGVVAGIVGWEFLKWLRARAAISKPGCTGRARI